MRAKTKLLVRITALIVAVSAVFGAVASWQSGARPVVGLVAGAFIGLAISVFENLLQGPFAPRIRRWPVALLLLFRTAMYGAAFFIGVDVSAALLSWSWEPILHPAGQLNTFTVLVSFVFAFAINFVLILRQLLGPGVVVSLFTGRYHRPREEERMVLFMDLRDSTQVAERIGDERFHRFLNQVFWDITDPLLEAGGDIYRYVGDEVIVTWAVKSGARRASCVECVFAIADALAARYENYRNDFGTEPRFRAALHAGPLIVGEMGDLKREIVMLGDTMNTTARIENVCRTMAKDVIASAAALRLLLLPAGVSAESLGFVPLRGKTSELELFALTRSERQVASTSNLKDLK